MNNILVNAVSNAAQDYQYPIHMDWNPKTSMVIEVFPATTVRITTNKVEVVREIVPPSLWSYCNEVISHNEDVISRAQEVLNRYHHRALYIQFLDYVYTDYAYDVPSKVFLLEAETSFGYSGSRYLTYLQGELEIPVNKRITMKSERVYWRYIRNISSWYKRGNPYGLYFRLTGQMSHNDAEYAVLYRNIFKQATIQRLILGG